MCGVVYVSIHSTLNAHLLLIFHPFPTCNFFHSCFFISCVSKYTSFLVSFASLIAPFVMATFFCLVFFFVCLFTCIFYIHIYSFLLVFPVCVWRVCTSHCVSHHHYHLHVTNLSYGRSVETVRERRWWTEGKLGEETGKEEGRRGRRRRIKGKREGE